MFKGIINKMRETRVDADKLQKVSEVREAAQANISQHAPGRMNINLR